MNAPKCQYCGAGIEAYFSSMNEHVYKCGSFNYSAQASRTCHCREREAHNNTKRERDEARERERIAALVHKALYDTVERERDETKQERDSLKLAAQREAEHHDRMVGELEKVYAERDEAREQNAKLKMEIEDTERAFIATENSWEKLIKENAKLRDLVEKAIDCVTCNSDLRRLLDELDQLKEEAK
jgi:hypothetical protein